MNYIYFFTSVFIIGCGTSLLSDARPGDISVIRRVPPHPQLECASLKTGKVKKLCIQGEHVKCIHLQTGIFIRRDDFEDLKNFLPQTFKSQSPIPEFAISLAIRAIWEGQSFVNIVAFRGGNNRKYPPYHHLRFQAVAREFHY